MLPYPEGFVFRGIHAAPELGKIAKMRNFQRICAENYTDLKPRPQEIHIWNHGDKLVVCMATSINEELLGRSSSKSFPLLINFVMPTRLREDFQAALLDEPGFVNAFLREMSPLFTPYGPHARDPDVRDAIFLKSDFSRLLLIW